MLLDLEGDLFELILQLGLLLEHTIVSEIEIVSILGQDIDLLGERDQLGLQVG